MRKCVQSLIGHHPCWSRVITVHAQHSTQAQISVFLEAGGVGAIISTPNVGSARGFVAVATTADHQSAHSQPRGSWWWSLTAGAALGGGWALINRDGPQSAARADSSTAPQTTPSAQTAISTLLVGPLLSLLKGTSPSTEDVTRHVNLLAAERQSLNAWELSVSLWGLATLSANTPTTLAPLQALASEARAKLPSMPLYDAIVTAWALYTLDLADTTLWAQLVTRVAAGHPSELDEPCQLYLLHAAMQQSSLFAASIPGAVSSLGPRASREEVEGLVKPLPKKMRGKLLAAHQEYVPFHPYIEGAYMLELHLLKSLPHLITTTAGAGPASAYSQGFGALTPADAAAAQTVTSDEALLGRVKRDVFFHWREDQLLDRAQKDLNQVTYILQRRMSLTLQQPPDIDLLLPTMRTAIFLQGDGYQQGLPSSSSSGSSSSKGDSSSSSGLDESQYLSACQAVVQSLLRSNFSPTGGFARKQVPGLVAAKQRSLTRRGWRCLELSLADVEAALGEGKVTNHLKSVAEQHARLEALLEQLLRV